jgi:hypothetical protein
VVRLLKLLTAFVVNQIYTFSLSSVDMLKEEHVTFEHLSAGFHGPGEDGSARISGLDVCAWKPVVITCGVDKSVRLWNYRDKTLELVKFFPRCVRFSCTALLFFFLDATCKGPMVPPLKGLCCCCCGGVWQ